MPASHEGPRPAEHTPDPSAEIDFDHLSLDALVLVDDILAQPGLNYTWAMMQVRTLAGFFNGASGLDEPTYNRLPEYAKDASQRLGETCMDYFRMVGLYDEIDDEFKAYGIDYVTERQSTRIALNHMDTHLFQADRQEQYRRQGAMYRGFKAAGMPETLDLPAEDPYDAEAERKASDLPYSEGGIREVLKVVGQSLRPIVEGYLTVAPENIDRNRVLAQAYQNIVAVRESMAFLSSK